MEFKVAVNDQPPRRLVGLKVRTTMADAPKDAPLLWERFGPRMPEASGIKDSQGSYAPCVMIDEQSLYYWATVEAPADRPLPEGMEVFLLPAGAYAGIALPTLAELGAAYTYLYGEWPGTQAEYAVDTRAPCYEYYPPNWTPNGSLEVCVPVSRK